VTREAGLTWLSQRVYLSVYLTEPGPPVEVARDWRERWWSWPWQPWRRTRTVVSQVPLRGALQQADGSFLMHPETWRQLRLQTSAHRSVSQYAQTPRP
jgi:hypothetical protein